MNKFLQKNISKILFISVCGLTAIAITVSGISNEGPLKASTETVLTTDEMYDEEYQTLDADIEVENLEDDESEQETRSLSESNITMSALSSSGQVVLEDDQTELDQDSAYQLISDEFNALQNKDIEVITKYFGVSDVFTPDTIGDRVTASKITCTSFEEKSDGEYEVMVHVCTMDYTKMNNDFTEASEGKTEDEAKRVVAQNLLDNKYDIHYNIPVTISNGEVLVSESLKQAITGGWYTGIGITLNPVECILESDN